MPRFITNRDVTFYKGINHELIDKVIETPVIIYSFDPSKQNSNLYGESLEKVYEPGVVVNALIDHPDETTDDSEGFGPNVNQTITCAFYRNTLKEKDFYPERGDIIRWNNGFYEIDGVIDNQLLGGRYKISHSIICSCVLVNKSFINVRGEK